MIGSPKQCKINNEIAQRYEEWKDGLPDMKWLEDIFPDNQQWKQFSRDLASVTKSVGESIEIGKMGSITGLIALSHSNLFSFLDPRLKQLGEQKVAEWRKWFDSRLDDAIEAAATQENHQLEGNFCFTPLFEVSTYSAA